MSITAIKAEELLMLYNAGDFSHLKPEKRKELHKKIMRQATPFREKVDPTINFDSLASFINKNAKKIV